MSSQFTIYRSTDGSAPVCSGSSGGLISVLDGCLVTGYGAKSAAGWTHPVATASNIASYKQGAGAGFGLVINDASPNVTSLGKEAWATGWEIVAGVGSPVGTGTNQYPLPAQLLTTGHCVIRKSLTNDATARAWVLVADASTFYLFILTADGASTYQCFMYGDVYSFASDAWRVAIIGRTAENTASAANEAFDNLTSNVAASTAGHFMARSFGGAGGSITFNKHGDAAKGSATNFVGLLQYPNGSDTELYLSPIWVNEGTTSTVRGLLRGIYQPCHPGVNFPTDGVTFSGTGAYTGKSFLVLRVTPNAGVVFIETSNTVLTN